MGYGGIATLTKSDRRVELVAAVGRRELRSRWSIICKGQQMLNVEGDNLIEGSKIVLWHNMNTITRM